MRTKTNQTGVKTPGRAVARLVLAALALAIVAVLVPSTAQASTDARPSTFTGTDGHTYTRLTDKSSFVYASQAYGETLFVDTAHETAAGFYYAQAGHESQTGRNFSWVYQPYGVRCLNDVTFDLVFNPWMNTYTCMFDAVAADGAFLGHEYVNSTAACQQNGTKPWAGGAVNEGTATCWNLGLLTAEQRWNAAPVSYHPCAPWETWPCTNTHYSWENGGGAKPWVAQPDACTGVPANANAYAAAYDADASPVGDPDASCTGAALAPNCTAAQSGLPACGGATENNIPVGPLPAEGIPVGTDQTASATVSATGESQTVTATKYATATRTKSVTVSVTARRRAYGRVFTGVGHAQIVLASQESRSRTVTVTTNGQERTATASCTAPTIEEATTCAHDKAHAAALALSNEATLESATSDATSIAAAEATAAAEAAAQAALANLKPSAAARATAHHQAAAKAKRAVQRKIRAYAATH